MIVANRKPFEEIKQYLAPYQNILVLGCGTCVAVCLAGGKKEVGLLASQLKMSFALDKKKVHISEETLERQCDREFLEMIRDKVKEYDALLSLACGAGIQYTAERFPKKVVLPAVNTTFLGVTLEQGVWSERCQGCGECILHLTGGVCPVARCAKSLFNGPCGGSSDGKCEVNKETDCAWQMIINRLKELGQLDKYEEIIPPKNWSSSRDGGPRTRVREDLKLS